jgi:hypothetical protein
MMTLLLATLHAYAQSVSGSITGLVLDSSSSAVPGASIKLEMTAQGFERFGQTDVRGAFTFTNLTPGIYRAVIAANGFRTVTTDELTLTASERLSIGTLVLQVGASAESVTVSSQGTPVQTASAERSGVVTSSQIDGLIIRGRNVTSLVQLLPGVVDLDESEGINDLWNLRVQGNRVNTNNVSLDGMSVNEIGTNRGSAVLISMDSVSEVKVLLSNYQAEYGRLSGASIQIVSKSGTKDFHGLGSYFKRHEQFNANNFFNNRTGIPRQRYRYNTWNYGVGGPIYAPRKFNRNRDKLFFYWSQERWPLERPLANANVTMPTAGERIGDFSDSLDLNGRLIPVRDPMGGALFPGNRVPASRIDRNGQALLNFFPQPNFTDLIITARRYNYIHTSELKSPIRMDMLKLDYNLNSHNSLAFNMTVRDDYKEGHAGLPTGVHNTWGQMYRGFQASVQQYIVRYQRVFSPALIGEFTAGYRVHDSGDVAFDGEVKKNRRDVVGFNLGQLYPASNPLNLIPTATFGGVSNAAQHGFDRRFPYVTHKPAYNLAANITKTHGAHTLKTGAYTDRYWNTANSITTFNGSFNFGRDVNNPLDTGYAYSNALLGVFSSYTESTRRAINRYLLGNVEWYGQDNWRIGRRLTLDFGVRFYWVPPMYERNNQVSTFVPGQYRRQDAIALIQPRLVGGRRVGVHPRTGEVVPAAQIGAIAPGSGNPYNGLVVPGNGVDYPRGLIETRGVQIGPRFGFAYDPFGKGKTALRGGFGMFYNRESVNAMVPGAVQVPFVETPTLYYGTLPTLLQSQGVVFPNSILGFDREGHVPTVMNYSFAIQQNIGFGTVIDIAYVGSAGRHLMWQRNLNAIPFGANFDPRNADPSASGTPLPANFLRPYPGYGDLPYREFAGTSNYHSMQVTANRRFRRGLEFGAAWTWAKALEYNDFDTDEVATLISPKVWNYGLAVADRTHVVKLNWLYKLPQTRWRNAPVRFVLHGWEVSGIASFISGAPFGIALGTVVATDFTGTPSHGARTMMVADPRLPKSERTFSRYFNTDAFRTPAPGTYGNAPRTAVRGPGTSNWDTALFKSFAATERVRFQFRWELYNAFNHTQFSSVDNAARFDAQGRQANGRFGELTAARAPRQMQFALRAYF